MSTVFLNDKFAVVFGNGRTVQRRIEMVLANFTVVSDATV